MSCDSGKLGGPVCSSNVVENLVDVDTENLLRSLYTHMSQITHSFIQLVQYFAAAEPRRGWTRMFGAIFIFSPNNIVDYICLFLVIL